MPCATLVEATFRGVAAMAMESETEADCAGLPLSFTPATKDTVPVESGVPDITPAVLRERPAGRLPEVSDQVYPGVPPLTERVRE